MRISGVPVGRVKTKELDEEDDTTSVEIELDDRYAPIPADTQRGAAPEDAARRDLRRADAGHEATARWWPTAATLAAGQVSPTVELDEIFRAFDAKTREAFRVWLDQQGRAFEGRGEDINDALGNLAPFAEDTSDDPRDPRPPRARDPAARPRHGRGLRRAHRAPGPAPAADRQLEPPLRGHRPRDAELAETFRDLPDLPRRVARHDGPADRVRERHRPARHPAPPGRARAVAHADLAGTAWRPT